jgi:ATP-binding cassette subfamily C protein
MSTADPQPRPEPRAPEAWTALCARGEEAEIGGDRPFLLHGPGLWLVAAGQVNVFTVRLDGGAPAGARAFLLQVGEGQALLGASRPDHETWGLLAVAASNTRVVQLDPATVRSDPGALVDLVEPWIQSLYGAMSRERSEKPPANAVDLEPGPAAEVASGAHVRVRGDVAWVRHVCGHSQLMGREGMDVNGQGFVPVTRGAWLKASEPSRIVAVRTQELESSADLWAGLMRLHGLVLRHAEGSHQEADVISRDRLRQRAAVRSAVLRDACERLALTLSAGGRAAATDEDSAVPHVEDPLFAACTVVGRALSLTIKPYPRGQGAAIPRDPLAAILRASRIRSRRVALRDGWWRRDNGPLLGCLREGRRPVALLCPKAAGPYLVCDPVARTERVIDASVALELEDFAFGLYRPFPERRLGVRDVVRFALHGCSRDIGVLIAVGICGSVLGMVPALATGALFNTVIPGAQRSQLLQLTCVLLASAVATALFQLAQNIALLRIEGRAGSGLQSAVWDRLLSLPLAFFRPYTSGDLAVRAMSIDAMRQVISGTTVTALLGGILAFGNFCLMFWYSSTMALWATLIIAIIILVTLLGSVLQLRPQREAMKLQSKAAGIVLQLLSSIAKVRVAGAEVAAFALWVRRFSEQRRLQYQARWISNWVSAFNAAAPLASFLVIFYIALPLMSEKQALGTGDFLAFLSAFSSSTSSLIGTCLALLASLNTIPLYEQAKPILEAVPEVGLAKIDPGVLTGDIEVQHAMFRYSHDGPPVLRDVSFRIQPGEFVAFVGPSGSGKSTLLRLLLGFETVEGGSIYYDGQEMGSLDVQALRRQIGVVLQSGRLLSGDVFTNIVGSATASVDEAWDAARMAGLAEDIEAMPMGMHTVISDGGGTLSGGQRQRLLIARAIVNRPRILLFDEATSALDNRTQAIVSASLERLRATRIVVAHRLSTIINADRIFVMERGRLVQSGSYADLMAQEGPFAELARRQIA